MGPGTDRCSGEGRHALVLGALELDLNFKRSPKEQSCKTQASSIILYSSFKLAVFLPSVGHKAYD